VALVEKNVHKLATNESDDRFRELQYLSDAQKIIIAAGNADKEGTGGYDRDDHI